MVSSMINGILLGFVASPTCPSNGEEIKQGTQNGFLNALSVGIGAVLGDAIVLVAVLFGFMTLIESYPLIESALWLIGGIILLYVSWGIFSELKTVQGVSKTTKQSPNQIGKNKSIYHSFIKGVAITTFNPFTVVWWIGLITPVIAANQSPILFSFAVLIGSLVWFIILAILLSIGRVYLNQTMMRWIIRLSGLVVLGYSLYFFGQFMSHTLL